MPFDLSKPYKRGGVTYHGYAKPDHPIFQVGPIIAGMTISELLGGSPKKTAEPTSSDSSSPTPDSSKE